MAENLIKILNVKADISDAQAKLGKLQTSVMKLKEARKQLTAQLKSGKITQRQYNQAIGANTIATKKAQMGVRQYSKSILVANGAMKKTSGFVMGIRKALTGMAGQFLGAMAAFMVVKNVIGIFKDFEQANADLAAVLGKTSDEITDLSEDAKKYGSVTKFTASEVSALQKEFAKLGFTTKEIKSATKATLDLAAATGTDLARAAEVTGATVRAFGLDASESQRVTDVMAKSFSSSALDMEKFATSMRSVAPVAKNAGLNIEQTTAMLGALTDRGIDASTSGTALRNVFLELSKQGLTFEEAMEKINTSTDKNKTALELFGKRGAVVGTILAETGEDVANLEAKLNNAGGAAKRMADTQLNTLEGALTILNSAWEGFILSLEDGQGTFAQTLKNIVRVITEVLSLATGTAKAREGLNEYQKGIRDTAESVVTFLKALKFVIQTFITYKAVMIGARIATAAYTFATTALRIAKVMLARGIGSATKAMKLFNTASKANIIGAIAAVVITLATHFMTLGKEVKKVTKEQKRYNEKLREMKELDEDVQGSEKSFEARKLLSKKGLENLKDTLAMQISAMDAAKDQAIVIATEEAGKEKELRKRLRESVDNINRQGIKQEIQTEQARVLEKIRLETGYSAKQAKKRVELGEKLRVINKQIADNEFVEKEDENKDKEDQETKAQDKLLAIKERVAEKLKNTTAQLLNEIDQLEIDAIQNKKEKEETQALFDFENKINKIEGESDIENQLRTALEEQLEANLQAIRDKYSDIESEKEKKATEESLKRQEESFKKKEAITMGFANDVGSVLGEVIAGTETAQENFGKSIALSGLKTLENVINLAIAEATARSLASAESVATFGVAGVAKSALLAALIKAAFTAAKVGISAKMERGGVLRGKSHAKGGIPTIDGQYEFEGGEAVINKRSTAKYGALLSNINQAEGGVAFERGGITKFQQGGISAPLNFPETVSDATGSLEQITSQMGAIKVVNVVTDTTDQQVSILNVQSEAEIG